MNEIANAIKDGRTSAGNWIFIEPTHPYYNELKKIIENRNNES